MNALVQGRGGRRAPGRSRSRWTPSRSSRRQALAFGATHTAASIGEAVGLVSEKHEVTWGPQRRFRVILTVGLADGAMIAPMMAMTAKGGRAVVTAVANMYATDVTLSLADLDLMNKQLGRHDLRFG